MNFRRGHIALPSSERPQNDTASLAELPDHSIYAAWRAEGPAGTFILASSSLDEGESWGEPRLLLHSRDRDVRLQAPALCVLGDGAILLSHLAWHGDLTTTMTMSRSVDGGENFSPLATPFHRSQAQWRQGGASSLVRLGCGRLILPVQGGGGYGTAGAEHVVATCMLSDDHGRSWRFSATTVDLPGRGALEPSIAESEGELLMSLRTQLGSVFASRSHDRGESWSPAESLGLRSPESGTCLRRVPGTSALVLLWNDAPFDPGHPHRGQRSPLSIARSLDGGRRWEKLGDVDSGPFSLTNLDCLGTSSGTTLISYNRAQGVACARLSSSSLIA